MRRMPIVPPTMTRSSSDWMFVMRLLPMFDVRLGLADTLWPANHKYVDVTATVVVSDNFDLNPTVDAGLGHLQ